MDVDQPGDAKHFPDKTEFKGPSRAWPVLGPCLALSFIINRLCAERAPCGATSPRCRQLWARAASSGSIRSIRSSRALYRLSGPRYRPGSPLVTPRLPRRAMLRANRFVGAGWPTRHDAGCRSDQGVAHRVSGAPQLRVDESYNQRHALSKAKPEG